MPGETHKWKKEFNSELRSRTYDAINDLFSLRRSERFHVVQKILPEPSDPHCNILELGTGTGVLTELLIKQYPEASIATVEGAEKMLKQAQAKPLLQKNNKRLQFIHADYSTPSWLTGLKSPFHLVITFDSLHHLSHDRTKELYGEIFDVIIHGGGFIISDHVTSRGLFYEDPQYDLWIPEIFDNLKNVKQGSDIAAALESISTRTYDDLQKLSLSVLRDIVTANLNREGENPMPIMEHIDVMREVGFDDVVVEYRFANFAIISARKNSTSEKCSECGNER